MKTIIPFQFLFPLISITPRAGAIDNGALLISGGYYRQTKYEPVIDHTHYELTKGTTLNDLMEWLTHNCNERILDAVEEHLRSLI